MNDQDEVQHPYRWMEKSGIGKLWTEVVGMSQWIDDNMIVCRCEEITLGEIKQAISEGARDVTGVKRRVRAGMGLCQGRTCERLVQQILCQELGINAADTGRSSARPPVRPITFGEIAEGVVE